MLFAFRQMFFTHREPLLQRSVAWTDIGAQAALDAVIQRCNFFVASVLAISSHLLRLQTAGTNCSASTTIDAGSRPKLVMFGGGNHREAVHSSQYGGVGIELRKSRHGATEQQTIPDS